MRHRRLRLTIGVVCLLTLFLSLGATAQDSIEMELEFTTYLEEGIVEQDVFIMGIDGLAFRVAPHALQSSLDEPIFGLAHGRQYAFDPFMLSPNPIGPYDLGEPLGITMEEWLAANGGGTYTIEGDTATVDFEFYDLVPNGVYTLWCSQMSLPPDFGMSSRPCVDMDDSNNVFTADENGVMAIQMSFPAMPLPTETQIPSLAIVWHADGQPLDTEPGVFGTLTFTQLHVAMVATEYSVVG